MIEIKSGLSNYNTESIIKFLDEKYDSLNKLRITIFGNNHVDKLVMNLTRKLYSCGCEVSLPSTDFDYYTNREIVERSDVVIAILENHEINDTFHPVNCLFIDITGNSVTKEFLDSYKDNKNARIFTSKDYD